jgi:hypothetical protein
MCFPTQHAQAEALARSAWTEHDETSFRFWGQLDSLAL